MLSLILVVFILKFVVNRMLLWRNEKTYCDFAPEVISEVIIKPYINTLWCLRDFLRSIWTNSSDFRGWRACVVVLFPHTFEWAGVAEFEFLDYSGMRKPSHSQTKYAGLDHTLHKFKDFVLSCDYRVTYWGIFQRKEAYYLGTSDLTCLERIYGEFIYQTLYHLHFFLRKQFLFKELVRCVHFHFNWNQIQLQW